MTKILKKIEINIEQMTYYLIDIEMIYAHELGHSLFLGNKPANTILEELKATLFYYLNLYDKLSKIGSNDIENLLKYIL